MSAHFGDIHRKGAITVQKVRIVTHSGCDISFAEAETNGIIMLPDLVIFGSQQYRNNIDIQPEEFFCRLASDTVFPTSAHPSLSDFMDAFRTAGDCEDIICIVMSAKMTGTFNTVTIAAQLLREEGFLPRIHIYDSMQVSFGMGIAVLSAAHLANSGATASEILYHLDELVPRIGVYFVMRSLKYAKKGGRIGAIKAVTADTLGVKPLDNDVHHVVHLEGEHRRAADLLCHRASAAVFRTRAGAVARRGTVSHGGFMLRSGGRLFLRFGLCFCHDCYC